MFLDRCSEPGALQGLFSVEKTRLTSLSYGSVGARGGRCAHITQELKVGKPCTADTAWQFSIKRL